MVWIGYIETAMNGWRLPLALTVLILTVAGAGLLAAEVHNVVSVEAGYAYAISARDLDPSSPHGLVSSLGYGYLLHSGQNSLSVLSLVLGYDLFPGGDGPNALHSLVYGVEYAHTFFKQSRVSLLLDYGLLFNLILRSGREGYAFGHHTRLGVGGLYNLAERHKLALKAAYNLVTFPYFEASKSRLSFPAMSLRYCLFF